MFGNQQDRFGTGERISWMTICANILLSLGKLIAGLIGNSQAMVADAVHSGSDVFATLGVILSLRISRQPADCVHPYGHGKAETVAGKLVAVVLILVGVSLARESYVRVRTGAYGEPGMIALVAALVSIVSKEAMYRATVSVGQRIRSSAIIAEAWHHRSDAFSSIGSFAGILGARMGYRILDPVTGIIVSMFIVWMGFKILLMSIEELMDAQVDPRVHSAIREAVERVKGAVDLHTVSTRRYGGYTHVDVRVGVSPSLSVVEAHDISCAIEREIEDCIPYVAGVMVHIDPETVHQQDPFGHGHRKPGTFSL